MYEAKANIDTQIGSERGFSIVVSAALALIGLHPLIGGTSPRTWVLVAAGVILTVGLVVPRLLAMPNRLWFRLGLALGGLVSQFVMAILFLLVVTPTGVLLRMSRRIGRLRTELPCSQSSTFWILRSPESDSLGSLRNQY